MASPTRRRGWRVPQGPGQLTSHTAHQAHITPFEFGAFEDATQAIKKALDVVGIRKTTDGKRLPEMRVHGFDFGHRRQGRNLPGGRLVTRLHDLVADHHDRLRQIE